MLHNIFASWIVVIYIVISVKGKVLTWAILQTWHQIIFITPYIKVETLKVSEERVKTCRGLVTTREKCAYFKPSDWSREVNHSDWQLRVWRVPQDVNWFLFACLFRNQLFKISMPIGLSFSLNFEFYWNRGCILLILCKEFYCSRKASLNKHH